jgi:hypothetical protein
MNLYRLFRRLGMMALLVIALPVNAADTRSADTWQFQAELYLWGSAIDIKPDGADDDIDISFSDIVNNLDMALMTTLSARKDKWSLLADIIYLDAKKDDKGSVKLVGIPIKVDVDAKVKTAIITAAGGYTIRETDRYRLDLLAGVRHAWLELDLDYRLGPVKGDVSPSDNATDGIIGVKGKADLSDKWYLTYYLDAGTGQSDYTWQGLAGLNYKFRKVDAVLGYRYLDWDFGGNKFDDITIKGPFAGVKFRF